jgi:nitroreductase
MSGTTSDATACLRDRYGDAAPAPPAAWNEVIAGQLRHRTVRAFLDQPLPDGAFEAAMAAAQSASTSSNLQGWGVVAVRDPERKARLAKLAGWQDHVRTAPLVLVWLADLSRVERIAKATGAPAGNLDYFETFLEASIDAAIAAQNAVVAFESLGLGVNFIGAMRNHPEDLAAELKLPRLAAPLFGLLVGRPDPAVQTWARPRLPQSAMIHEETYAARDEADVHAAYDETIAAFRRAQGRAPAAWTSALIDYAGKPGALYGRERLRQALEALGFPFA